MALNNMVFEKVYFQNNIVLVYVFAKPLPYIKKNISFNF